MTKQSFRREINMMAKKTSKKKVLEMFATVIQDKHSKMSKSKKTKTSKKVLDDSSDSEESTGSTNETKRWKSRTTLKGTKRTKKVYTERQLKTLALSLRVSDRVQWK
jgi:hypothetical protein